MNTATKKISWDRIGELVRNKRSNSASDNTIMQDLITRLQIDTRVKGDRKPFNWVSLRPVKKDPFS